MVGALAGGGRMLEKGDGREEGEGDAGEGREEGEGDAEEGREEGEGEMRVGGFSLLHLLSPSVRVNS